LSVSLPSTPGKEPIIIVLTPEQFATQHAAIKRIQTLPDAKAMKAARVHALQKRITALQAELTAIIKEMLLITSH
jgi:hypothetical protein